MPSESLTASRIEDGMVTLPLESIRTISDIRIFPSLTVFQKPLYKHVSNMGLNPQIAHGGNGLTWRNNVHQTSHTKGNKRLPPIRS